MNKRFVVLVLFVGILIVAANLVAIPQTVSAQGCTFAGPCPTTAATKKKKDAIVRTPVVGLTVGSTALPMVFPCAPQSSDQCTETAVFATGDAQQATQSAYGTAYAQRTETPSITPTITPSITPTFAALLTPQVPGSGANKGGGLGSADLIGGAAILLVIGGGVFLLANRQPPGPTQ